MLVSLVIILVITAGGFALSYFLDRDEPLMWRAAAGNVIGCALFGTLAFVLAMLFGLSAATVVAALLITAAPVALLTGGARRKAFERDWRKAKGNLNGANTAKALRFAYYLGFFVLLLFFFDRAMMFTPQGISTGGSNNLGDLPFHLGAIYSFTDGANFPPENPSFAGAKFSYPFIADLITACFMKLGADLRDAMFVQNMAWALSLLVVLERFVLKETADRAAGKIAPVLLFFSGGLGFLWYLADFFAQGRGFFEFVNAIPKDYTIGDDFRWGNSLTTLFLTQRSLLLGMPITLVVLGFLWKVFVSKKDAEVTQARSSYLPPLIFGILAGTLPLIHLHSLAVLFIVTAVMLMIRRDRWKEFFIFGAGVCVIAVPELIWSSTGSASRATEFFDWHFGFDARENNILWFWIKNTGLLFPLLALGIYLSYRPQDAAKDSRKKKDRESAEVAHARGVSELELYIPFALLFVIGNVAKLAPWEWDNIKVLIYWFVGSLPFIAVAVMWMWRHGGPGKAAAVVCMIVLTASGALDVWRVASRQMDYRAFDAEAVALAERVKTATPPRALFLNTPTYNSAVVLTGRPSFIRYPGHLSSHGIDYREREEATKRIYEGGPEAVSLMEKYGIEYVLLSPEELSSMRANEAFFARFPLAAQAGQYKVYKVR
jgi:hypothetical protein